MRQAFSPARFGALRAVRELAGCSDRDIWSLLRHADEVHLRAGDLVAPEGLYCTAFVAVIEGTLGSRSQSVSRMLRPGDSCGWDAMWERFPNRETITAETDARLLVIGNEQFRAMKALAGPPAIEACAFEMAEAQIVA